MLRFRSLCVVLFCRAEFAKTGGDPDDDKGVLSPEFAQKTVMPVLKHHFKRDEFIGRINEILFFLPFTEKQRLMLANKEVCGAPVCPRSV